MPCWRHNNYEMLLKRWKCTATQVAYSSRSILIFSITLRFHVLICVCIHIFCQRKRDIHIVRSLFYSLLIWSPCLFYKHACLFIRALSSTCWDKLARGTRKYKYSLLSNKCLRKFLFSLSLHFPLSYFLSKYYN